MKILVLHSRLSGYWMACMRAFVKKCNGSFTVIAQQANPNAPFKFESTDSISLHQFESFTENELYKFCIDEKPDLVYSSGWSQSVYLKISRYFYRQNIPVLCGLDNQWENTLRQKAGFWFLKKILPKRFTHLWIPGLYQFEVARKLGFPKEKILTGLYSANVPLFSEALKKDEQDFPRSFIFLGRLVARKGLNELVAAYNRLTKQAKYDWSLTVVGDGPLKEQIKKYPEVKLIDFVQPENLPKLMKNHGVFVLPSTVEPWGVVIHEAAAAGLPIISTHNCGAATAFVRNGYNGYVIDGGDTDALFNALNKISQKEDAELYEMSKRSSNLSLQITPSTWASTLFELIQKYS